MRATPLLLALALLAGCATPAESPGSPTAAPPAPSRAPSASPLAAWSVTDTDGATWTDAGLQGKPALIFFMASWCGTCAATAPKVARLHDEFGERAQFLSIDFDPSETQSDIEEWKRAKDQPWPHALDPQRDVQLEYGVKTQSVIVVLDETGAVVWKSGYGPKEEDARQALRDALAAA